jgi:hypothetical protein
MRRRWPHPRWCLATALSSLLLAALAGWGAEARPLPVPERRPLRLEVTVLRLDPSTKILTPVRADSPFKTGDVVAFEVKASLGGYLALHVDGTVWPQQAAGRPTPAQASVRVPESWRLRLTGASPTKLSLVFSPSPLDGSTSAGKRRWLEQIVLREAKLEPGEAPAGPVLIFEGSLGEAEKAVVQLELRHP